MSNNLVMLTILDGFGLGDAQDATNAVVQANPTHFKQLWDQYPHTTLDASGEAVGLPDGQMGNSEVGHLNLGSGRIVYQDLTRITKDIEDGAFFEKTVMKELYKQGAEQSLHIIALLSDGNVHCSLMHVKAVLAGAAHNGLTNVYVHGLLDGRDVPPQSAIPYIEELETFMSDIGVGKIATIAGRYYGMDRDNRWDRIALAYQAMVDGTGKTAPSAVAAVEQSYAEGVNDEFVVPTVINTDGMVKDGDAVIFCNFRPDRGRELTKAFVLPSFDAFNRTKRIVYMATMTKYEEGLPVHVVYEKDTLDNTLGYVLSEAGKRQLRIAETEKYAHVTYFFNGGVEEPFAGEDRILVDSPKVATYDLQPEMSAHEVTDKVVDAITSEQYDVIILNFANPDMVGHTGDFNAAVKAIQAVDTCLGRIYEAIQSVHGKWIITADHGNAEEMVNHETEKPQTAHTTNVVPCIYVCDDNRKRTLHPGKLCDIAPTILELAGVPQPPAMTGTSLLD